MRLLQLIAVCSVVIAFLGGGARAQQAAPAEGTPVLPADALLTTPVGGLERTKAAAAIVDVTGQSFAKALRVTIGTDAPDTNATQLTMGITAPVAKGDALLATFYLRGAATGGKRPAQMMFLFEKNVDPWTKSATEGFSAGKDLNAWKRVVVPFTATESYQPGEAMVSLRFAFQPQTVEVGGLSVLNFGKTKTVEQMRALAAEQTPLGKATVAVDLKATRQTLLGFGGDFAEGRYGSSEMIDPVGQYNLAHLKVVHARVGIPLNHWAPEKGVYKDEGPAHGVFLLMQELTKRDIPMVGSIWEAPAWLVGGKPEESGKTLPPEKYGDAIEAIARFLVTARDKYGATVDNLSFNEADYGVNVKFTSAQIAAFIKQAGPVFARYHLKTKWLVGDTANGGNFAAYARPLLADKALAPYLGPIAFHCWDVLTASDSTYAGIAALGKEFKKPIWCTEAGFDSGLWQQPSPWDKWDSALRLAQAYVKTLNLSGASLMDYWTYEDNYPLVSRDGTTPYATFAVVRQLETALPTGARVAAAIPGGEDLWAIASSGPGDGFGVVVVNPVGAGEVTFTGLPAGAKVAIRRSDAGQQEIDGDNQMVGKDGTLTLPVSARSVITIARKK
jgi:O-glycosyl hydrolase